MSGEQPLRVLVVDDEQPALDELAFLLGRDQRVGDVHTCSSATAALRLLHDQSVDAVFIDIHMPGLTGLELAAVLSRFKVAPQIVFVTAYEEHAVDAFELHAVDYLLKPVRQERLREAVRRVSGPAATNDPEESIPVELAGVTRFVARSEVTHVTAQGDYVRLHTVSGSHLLRVPLGSLESRWQDAGFLRIHRSALVSLLHVDEVRTESGRCSVLVGGEELLVSRRHTPALREMLRRNRQGEP